MELPPDDRALVEDELGRAPNRVEEALFVNLWSEHCAYRSSRPALADLPSDADHVVIGPGDDAAVVDFPSDVDGTSDASVDGADGPGSDGDRVLAMGIESHNHPSYVDPYDGAATGVGGIVRDILSMGARPIALMDCIYFGGFDREKTRYLFEGVVEGIADYGNSIGVPTVGGQTYFDESYDGNPLVNVMCVGVAERSELLTADLQEPGNRLVLVGAASGRDGLGGASFASEDLDEEAESEDRPAVQVGDPYTEKLLIDATEELRDHVEAARDLGAAGLAGASSEMAAKAGLGARVALDDVYLREEGMGALEILLSESQERMLYEVRPDEVEAVEAIAERYDLEASDIGAVTDDGRYVATFEGNAVVDLPAEFLADGAPVHDLERAEPATRDRDVPPLSREAVLDALASPNEAANRWIYRQYDHEVQTRTVVKPGDDAAVLGLEGRGLAISAGCDAQRVAAAPYEGGREAVHENAVNLAAKGAMPLALVNCLNFGNPERPEIYGGFRDAVAGLGDAAEDLDVPVVGGNVSLYNESEEYGSAVAPTPTVGMVGVGPVDPPRAALDDVAVGTGVHVLEVPQRRDALEAAALAAAAAGATHDVSGGGLAVALAEMVGDHGAEVACEPGEALDDAPGRIVLATDEPPEGARRIGQVIDGPLRIAAGDREVALDRDAIADARDTIEREM